MEYLYLICVLVSLGMLFWLKIFNVRNSILQFITLLVITVSNLGFYFTSVSTTLSEALLAQKLAYVGGVFLPVFFFLMVFEICHIEIPKGVSIVLLLIQCVIYGLACTIGSNELFYKSAEIVTRNGTTLLLREYGPLHALYLLTMYGYLISAVAFVMYSLYKKRTMNRRGVIAMLVLSWIAIGAYIFEKVMHLEYEIVPMFYIMLVWGALIPVYRANLYTVYEKKDIIDEHLGKFGFLIFDKKRVYQDSNNFMEQVFPELIDYHVGQKIEGCTKELQMLIDQIDELEKHPNKHSKEGHEHKHIDDFWLNDKCYAGTIHEVTNAFGVLKGYAIEIEDDTANRQIIELKEKYNEELSQEVYEKTKRIRRIQQKTILGIAQMVESRDLSTGGHIKRTSDVVKIFSKKLLASDLGFDKRFLRLVMRSAPMHDLGKIGVDDAILRKQGRFTPEEYEIMKKHSEIGYHMVSEIISGVEEDDFVRIAENVAHYHHEKIDGTGYPHGLKGDEIPVEARIMALADVFDALVSKRCYKEAFSYDDAFAIIEKDSGTHFDAQLAKVFISCRAELEDYYNKSED